MSIMLFLGNIGATEIIIIALIILLLFGGRKIPEMMRGIGKGIRSFKEGMKDINEVAGGRIVPEWLDCEDNFKGTVKNLPTREQIDVPVDEMLIVELYSK